jgi:hypothetical protein
VLAIRGNEPVPSDPASSPALGRCKGVTQQLAMEVIAQPRDRRERLIRHLGALYGDGIAQSGQSPQIAARLGDLLAARLRDQVARIEARGGGTVGTA